MITSRPSEPRALARREVVVGALGLVASLLGRPAHAAPAAHPLTVYKDPNCGCCNVWAERMAATGRFRAALVNEADMIGRKTRLRVPPEVASCHTSVVGRYVLEGHVPPADVLRLLQSRPTDIVGLAVPGMPAGSPGMEMPDGRRDPYEVLAFRADGRLSIFARHR
jgi:hypothetical protein